MAEPTTQQDLKRRILARLGRIEGQARGIRRMIEEGRDCADVITQVAALRAAVAQVGVTVLRAELAGCLALAQQDGRKGREGPDVSEPGSRPGDRPAEDTAVRSGGDAAGSVERLLEVISAYVSHW